MEITKKIEKDILTVEVVGHVDATTAPELEKLVQQEGPNVKQIVFDFSKVEYISSAGLRVLLGTHKLMVAKGGSFLLKGVQKDVKNILEMTGFLGFLQVK